MSRDHRRELVRCGLRPVPDGQGGWLATIDGPTGPLTVVRGNHYWMVHGRVPLATALQLYGHPVGRTDIRVAGHCGCPPPEAPWVSWYLGDEQVHHDPDGEGEREWDDVTVRYPLGPKPRFERDPAAIGAEPCIDLYHVDTELGLYVLVQAVTPCPCPCHARVRELQQGHAPEED